MDRKDGLYLALSSMFSSVLISAVLHAPSPFPNFYSDLVDSFWGRDWVQAGALPYLHSYFEYPPISGLLVYIARMVGNGLNGYYASFSIMILAASLVVAWASWRTAKFLGRELNPMYFLMPSFVVYGVYNFDVFHAAFLVLSLMSFMSGRRSLSAIFLGLGVDTKLVSVVLLPIFILELKGARERLRYFALFAVVVATFNLPFFLLNSSNFIQGYIFLRDWGLEDAWYVWIFQNPDSWGYAKLFGLAVSGLLLLRVYTMKASLPTRSFLAIAAYLLGTYIYAPQFNLLLLPLLALMDVRHPTLYLWDAFNALIILTWFAQPNPTHAGSLPQLFALLRTGALALLSLSVASSESGPFMKWFSSVLRV